LTGRDAPGAIDLDRSRRESYPARGDSFFIIRDVFRKKCGDDNMAFLQDETPH
jgi:hypothetical protein